ncbi:MAG: DUF4276 family protein [Victivallales bacterium]|nr:DUF4276 family protein [Victivallales bacterium]
MIRLNITTEGLSEKVFVDSLLCAPLLEKGIQAIAYSVTTSVDRRIGRSFKGGLANYAKVKRDLERRFREYSSPHDRFTTMFDLYALPADFPEMEKAHNEQDPYRKVQILEQALFDDLHEPRLIPYIQLHEFETLLLTEPDKLIVAYPNQKNAINNLVTEVGRENPELINGGKETSPSKRILKYLPEYDKVNAGLMTVISIGLSKLRERCRHFNEWLSVLENYD